MTFRCLSVLLLGGAAVIWGQSTTSTITGVVKDTSGAVIPAAKVQVVNENSGVAISAVSNEAEPRRNVERYA